MESRKTRFFHELFRKRPREQKTSPEKDGRPVTTNSSELELGGQVMAPDAADAPSIAKTIAPSSSIVGVCETDRLSAAFDAACSSLREEQRVALESAQGVQELFQSLNTSNEESIEGSPFRRGAQKLRPVLGLLGTSINLANPLATFDPIANNAFGIIQSVMTIAIGVCGAEGEFQEHIQAMLQRIPTIERCDDIWESVRSPDSLIFPVLVRIYTDLLNFYFEAMEILKSSSFFIGLQKSRFRQKLPEIASSFADNVDQLDKILNVETLALIQKIDDDQSSIKVRMLLHSSSQSKEVEYYNSLKQRADEACRWIVSMIEFREWLEDPNEGSSTPSSKFCILFGNMGSGKSITTGFVVDFLVSHPALSGSLKPFVCVYYCKNDNETNKARNIYRSILSQILTRMVRLKSTFMKWYKEQQTKSSLVDPTLDDNLLRDFLVNVLRRFSRRVYLVLDGVDECDYDNRDHILDFFQKFNECGALVHVFLSCRYDELIKERLPPGRRILQMDSSPDRDRMIAAFHTNHLLSRQSEDVKALIISELTGKAEGSAIWLKLVLEYLRHPHRSEKEIKRVLKSMPSPQSLSKLYGKLFETAVSESSDATKIEYALEVLAVSGRVLTMEELAYAVTLRMEHEQISSLAELEECVIDPTGLLELISPFVSIMDSAGAAKVRIVHQSLKGLIVREAPAEWGSHDGASSRENQREWRLHSSLLQCCIKYLLLSDLEDKDLFPEQKLEEMEEQVQGLQLLGLFDVYGDETQAGESQSPGSSTSREPLTRDFDPESAGFGKFFTYAACYWTDHFKQCSPDALPDVDDVSKLACHGSLTLRNWMETYKRPNLTSSPQLHLDVEDYDELVVSVYFGSHAFLTKFLACKSESDFVREQSCIRAIKWAMQSGDLTAVRILLQSKCLADKLRSGPLICQIMTIWTQRASKQNDIEDKWKELLEIIVHRFFNGDASSYNWANTILCSAARQGCLPVIKILFEKASKDPEFSKALLEETQNDTIYQSIGEAANYGRVDVVQYLLTQEYVDITPHLHHHAISKNPSQGPSNLNVLHCAARSKNPDIMRILVEKYPDGVNEQTESGDTPLQLLVFDSPTHVEAVRILIEIGKADVNFSPGSEWCLPLRTAIRAQNVEVCQLFVAHGAHVDDAITFDGSGALILKDSLEDAETAQCILKILASASQSEACKRYLSLLED